VAGQPSFAHANHAISVSRRPGALCAGCGMPQAPEHRSVGADAGLARQDQATQAQESDIACALPSSRLCVIPGKPCAAGIEERPMITFALPSPWYPRAVRDWLQAALARLGDLIAKARRRPDRQDGNAEASDEFRFRLPAHAPAPLGFREFTAPPRLQSGGSPQLRSKAAGRITAFAIPRADAGQLR
jgi:hypothetical protein